MSVDFCDARQGGGAYGKTPATRPFYGSWPFAGLLLTCSFLRYPLILWITVLPPLSELIPLAAAERPSARYQKAILTDGLLVPNTVCIPWQAQRVRPRIPILFKRFRIRWPSWHRYVPRNHVVVLERVHLVFKLRCRHGIGAGHRIPPHSILAASLPIWKPLWSLDMTTGRVCRNAKRPSVRMAFCLI